MCKRRYTDNFGKQKRNERKVLYIKCSKLNRLTYFVLVFEFKQYVTSVI